MKAETKVVKIDKFGTASENFDSSVDAIIFLQSLNNLIGVKHETSKALKAIVDVVEGTNSGNGDDESKMMHAIIMNLLACKDVDGMRMLVGTVSLYYNEVTADYIHSNRKPKPNTSVYNFNEEVGMNYFDSLRLTVQHM